jgi:hypothetical protein
MKIEKVANPIFNLEQDAKLKKEKRYSSSSVLASGILCCVIAGSLKLGISLTFSECDIQAGVPDGVINVVTGFGPTAGAAISSHMDVDVVRYHTFSCQLAHEH